MRVLYLVDVGFRNLLTLSSFQMALTECLDVGVAITPLFVLDYRVS